MIKHHAPDLVPQMRKSHPGANHGPKCRPSQEQDSPTSGAGLLKDGALPASVPSTEASYVPWNLAGKRFHKAGPAAGQFARHTRRFHKALWARKAALIGMLPGEEVSSFLFTPPWSGAGDWRSVGLDNARRPSGQVLTLSTCLRSRHLGSWLRGPSPGDRPVSSSPG